MPVQQYYLNPRQIPMTGCDTKRYATQIPINQRPRSLKLSYKMMDPKHNIKLN
jgi:hypothetical protein